ncbi:MAG TPA: hypothetical protein VKJ83_09645, partial [Actinomycetota bacterium]|nr:hypothetical protein [Actinomycetota bacterium]
APSAPDRRSARSAAATATLPAPTDLLVRENEADEESLWSEAAQQAKLIDPDRVRRRAPAPDDDNPRAGVRKRPLRARPPSTSADAGSRPLGASRRSRPGGPRSAGEEGKP